MKSIYITGGASGIGLALARLYSAQGCIVGIQDILDIADLQSLATDLKRLGGDIFLYSCSVTDSEKTRNSIISFAKKAGSLDIIYVHAGKVPQEEEGLSQHTIAEYIETNYYGALNAIFPAIEIMKVAGGTIVTSNSIGSLVSTQNSGAYSASKAALKMYIDSLRLNPNLRLINFLDATLGFVNTASIRNHKHAIPILTCQPIYCAQKLAISVQEKRKTVLIPRMRSIPWVLLSIAPLRVKFLILANAKKLFR